MSYKKALQAAVLVAAASILCFAAADAPPTYLLGAGDEVTIWAQGVEEITAHPFRVEPGDSGQGALDSAFGLGSGLLRVGSDSG